MKDNVALKYFLQLTIKLKENEISELNRVYDLLDKDPEHLPDYYIDIILDTCKDAFKMLTEYEDIEAIFTDPILSDIKKLRNKD